MIYVKVALKRVRGGILINDGTAETRPDRSTSARLHVCTSARLHVCTSARLQFCCDYSGGGLRACDGVMMVG